MHRLIDLFRCTRFLRNTRRWSSAKSAAQLTQFVLTVCLRGARELSGLPGVAPQMVLGGFKLGRSRNSAAAKPVAPITSIATKETEQAASAPSQDQDQYQDQEGSQGRRIGMLQILVIVALLAAAFIFSREPTRPATPSNFAQAAATSAAPTTSVSVIRPMANAHQVRVLANGSIGVRSFIDLTPQVSGRIASLGPAMRSGGKFAAGETLLVLESDDFDLQVRQAQADLNIANANLQLQRAKSDVAVRNYALINPQRPVPPLVALEPQIAQARAQVDAARARLDSALLASYRSRFALPFDGMVTQSLAEVGQLLVSGRSFGQAYATDSIELELPLPTADLALLQPVEGREVRLMVNGVERRARIQRVSAKLDERTRFARVYVPLPKDPNYQPGVFVDAEIFGATYTDSLLLPETALQASSQVWVVREGTLTAVQPKMLGRTESGIVVEGFDIADGIVVGQLPGAYDGMLVSTRPAG